MKNPSLNDLVGGICSVTLGDDEAKRRGVQKSILERQVGAGSLGCHLAGSCQAERPAVFVLAAYATITCL